MTSNPDDYPSLTLKPAAERKGKEETRQKGQNFSQWLSYIEYLPQNRPKTYLMNQAKQNRVTKGRFLLAARFAARFKPLAELG